MTYQELKTIIDSNGDKWMDAYKEKVKTDSVSVGDLFYTSWGYDQTNYDYIIVISVSSSGKSCVCKRAKAKHLGNTGWGTNEQKPIKEPYGLPFRMQIKKATWRTTPDIVLRGSYIFCGGEDETHKRLDTFSRVGKDDTFYETDANSGH